MAKSSRAKTKSSDKGRYSKITPKKVPSSLKAKSSSQYTPNDMIRVCLEAKPLLVLRDVSPRKLRSTNAKVNLKITLGKTASTNSKSRADIKTCYDDDNDVVMREAGEIVVKPDQYIVYSNGKNSRSKHFLPCKSVHRRELERLQRKKEVATRQDEFESKDEEDINSLSKLWNTADLTTHDEEKNSKGWMNEKEPTVKNLGRHPVFGPSTDDKPTTLEKKGRVNEKKPFSTNLGSKPVFGHSSFGLPATLDEEKSSKSWMNERNPTATNLGRQPVFGQSNFGLPAIDDEEKNSKERMNEKKPFAANRGSQSIFGQRIFESKEGVSSLNPTGFLSVSNNKTPKFGFSLKKVKKDFDRTALFSAMRNVEEEGESDDDDLDRSESGDTSESEVDDL